MAWAAAMSALAADWAGAAGAIAGRLLARPPLPSPLRAAVSVADSIPQVRGAVERRLGALRADVLLGVANAVVQGAGQGSRRTRSTPSTGCSSCTRSAAAPGGVAGAGGGARRGGLQPRDCGARTVRPCPPPDGPVERAADRTALGDLLGDAGVLAGTHDAAAAADLLMATLPKAARHGREAFAAVLAHDLARRGVVQLDPGALRRLDRVSAVVIDSAVLCDTELRLLSAVSTGDELDDAGVWRAADALLAAYGPGDLQGPGPWAGADGRRLERAPDAPSGGPADPAGVTLDLIGGRGERAAGSGSARPSTRWRRGCWRRRTGQRARSPDRARQHPGAARLGGRLGGRGGRAGASASATCCATGTGCWSSRAGRTRRSTRPTWASACCAPPPRPAGARTCCAGRGWRRRGGWWRRCAAAAGERAAAQLSLSASALGAAAAGGTAAAARVRPVAGRPAGARGVAVGDAGERGDGPAAGPPAAAATGRPGRLARAHRRGGVAAALPHHGPAHRGTNGDADGRGPRRVRSAARRRRPAGARRPADARPRARRGGVGGGRVQRGRAAGRGA
ncbi:hypothetical protein BJF79_02865 [Actinomadura sp. CNU-125]|uniref:hypothetical protein n=1 Tax=Actinomadura sp. CNU-125 TaxID=1904961 RepID=UPI000969B63B|nr:hypothetical protein [Actinomadura sp. CNU-125]OLT14133.1 hypothetical protein BJF79_02865 [Actinomadura sp. CNU-125]